MTKEQFDALMEYIDTAIRIRCSEIAHPNDIPRLHSLNETIVEARERLAEDLVIEDDGK